MFEKKERFDYKYEVTRSKRKTISIIIEPTGLVRILVPNRYADKHIKLLLQEKHNWIVEKLKYFQEKKIQTPDFTEGTKLDFLGFQYEIQYSQVVKKNEERIIIENSKCIIFARTFDTENLKEMIENWYRKEATEILKNRMSQIQQKVGKEPSKVSVKTQKKRWGSCTSKGHILLNWRLILAPVEVVDYVILHELCHLHHMDHSPKFWGKVMEFDPHYQNKRKWLKQNGHIIRWPYDEIVI